MCANHSFGVRNLFCIFMFACKCCVRYIYVWAPVDMCVYIEHERKRTGEGRGRAHTGGVSVSHILQRSEAQLCCTYGIYFFFD